jgi:phenylalanyl-tRNA synthetase beta chain
MLGMLCSLGIEAKVVAAQGEKDLAHTSRVGSILSNGEDIGYVAELHPSISSGLGLKKRVNFAVLHAPLTLPEPELEKYKGLDRFPSVAFTLSLLVPKRTTIGEVMDLLQDAGGEIVQDMAWLGNYEGESIPEGQLSMTITMNFRRSDRTMKGDEIQALQDQLVAAANQKGYHLREG